MSSRAEQKAQAREARIAAEQAARSAATRRRHLMIFGGVLAAAAAILIAVLLLSGSGDDRTPAGERVSQLDGIPQQGPWLGAPSAPVVVEEYADLQCPFCARFSTDELPALVTEYVEPGRVRMRLQTLTFLGADSVEAGRMAVAAGLQNRQWQFTEAFYADQGAENSGYVTEEFLRDVATRAGVDADRALRDSRSGEVTDQLNASQRAASAAGVQSTPTFRVGRRGGALRSVTADELRAAIDAALRQG
jgi:protein-disulfide isomerase